MLNKTSIQAIILAAGSSSRFHTDKTKLSYQICGQELILYPVRLFKKLNIDTTLVVGYQKETIKEIINKSKLNVDYIYQEKQLGTGHALLCAQDNFYADNILIINGDTPLIKQKTIEDLINFHIKTKSTVSFVASYNHDKDNHYGRVIKNNNIIEIIEAKELKNNKSSILNNSLDNDLINAGIYLINKNFLDKALKTLIKSSLTNEFYITDLIKKASLQELKVNIIITDLNDIIGINTLKELNRAQKIKQKEINDNYLNKGIYLKDPKSILIDIDSKIEPNSIIEANTNITGKSYIASGVTIKSGSIIDNSFIDKNTVIENNTIINDSKIKEFCKIGPFANIKLSTIGNNSIIGNFVEVKKSNIKDNTKAKHLSYIGQSEIGSNVNIGAGIITCNYNGVNKNTTNIQDNAFIGSNSTLIAPVSIGKDSLIAAGSVITENVNENDLAIARSRQTNKKGYASLLIKRYKDIKKNNNNK